MRKLYLPILIFAGLFLKLDAKAQVKIGTNGVNIFPSSLLELESDNKGLLIPRMPNTVAIDALGAQEGMLIYITTPPAGLYVRRATFWEHLAGFGSGLATNVTGTIAIANGGTGQTTALTGFNALSPMRNQGDLIYGGIGGSALTLGIGSATQILKGGATAPTWGALDLTTDVSTSILPPVNGGTGVANSNTLTLSGANIALTATGATNVTLPTTGILATRAGIEPLTNKTINGNIITASTGTLTLAAGSTLTTVGANVITLTSTAGGSSVTVPTSGILATRGGAEALTNKTINGNTITAGTGTLTLAPGQTFTTTAGSITLNSANPSNVTLPTSGVLVAALTGTASISFPSTATGRSSDGLTTIPVLGALDGEPVSLGVPNAAMLPGYTYTAWVSANDQVSVRFTNTSAIAVIPPATNFTVKILR